VTFEGPDGAGKSTVLGQLAARLAAERRPPVRTRQPGGTEAGAHIRQLLLDPDSQLPDRAELLLFCADRAAHIDQVIRPALQAGLDVLCDRFVHSNLAYQGYGRGVDLDLIDQLNAVACDGIAPDLVVLVDIDPQTSRDRLSARAPADRIEAASEAFHRRVRDGYLAMAAAAPDRFLVVDGSQDPARSAAMVAERLAATAPTEPGM